MSTAAQAQTQTQAQARLGRPKVGIYRLQCILPAQVLNELMNVENETNVYRTRIAAQVLCEWAEQQRRSRSQRMPSC